MKMFTDDPTNPIDRIRLKVGDTDNHNEYLDDRWYTYYLSSTNGNEVIASIEIAKAILVRFTGHTREVVDQVEIYGNQRFEQYLKWLKDFVDNPNLSGFRSPVPFAGGIPRQDMFERRSDPDNNIVDIPDQLDDDYHDRVTIWNANERNRQYRVR